jgi:hypothetical protein
MFKIGNYIINESAIAYVNLNAKKRLSQRDIEGVGIYFIVANHIACLDEVYAPVPDYLFFTGKDAEGIREYYSIQRSIIDVSNLVK